MGEPFVSIVMGCYNPKDLDILHTAVQSIIGQSYTNWEMIICDDGSEDPYREYIQDLRQMDSRIHCYRTEENHGLAHAMNVCLLHARGSLIARMDDDDISEPCRLEKQVQFLMTHPEYDWVGSQTWLMDKNGIWGTSDRPEIPDKNSFLKYSPYVHPSVLFRRSTIDQIGGYCESSKVCLSEDYDLFMRLTASGFQGYNMKERLFQYRENASTIRKRNLQRSFHEMYVRWNGFHEMGILSPKTVPFVIKPLVVKVLSMTPRFAQKIRLDRSTDIHRIRARENRKKINE